MSLIAFDTETALISEGRLAPPLSCMTYSLDGESPVLVSHHDAPEVFRSWLERKIPIVGHNTPFDMAVMAAKDPYLLPAIFQAYEEGLVEDTKILAQLRDIRKRGIVRTQKGWYSLGGLSQRYLKREMAKGEDTWRLRYGELIDTPLEQWPEEAKAYALLDAITTYQVYAVLKGEADSKSQAKHAFWLHLISAWGMVTDPNKTRELEQHVEAEKEKLREALWRVRLVDSDGKRKMKGARDYMLECYPAVRRTPSGQVSLDSDACELSADPIMQAFAEYSAFSKVMANDVPLLKKPLVQTSYGLVATGRTSSYKPNIQNLRRMPGIREAFIPRPGYVFVDADYNALELYSLAQTCLDLFGQSALAEALQAGSDPHTMLAADILGLSIEEAKRRRKDKDDDEFDNARQTAKVCNFGMPGGLGAEKLVWFARKSYDVVLTVDRAKELKQQWFSRWPEMRKFFDYFGRAVAEEGVGQLTIRRSKRTRGQLWYTACCNTSFQGPASDAAKEAGWLLSKACYVDRESILFGSRPVAFIHDQFLVEVLDDSRAHDKAFEVALLMQEGAKKHLPDVVPPVEPLLSRCWSKKAKQVFENERLVPWSM